ncbi:hypothetical protein FF011L_53000 [Roseimaritima multifibrata]|uniref:Uncharacterized protein n=2 Tax=Roseimaritima multifibrata TaxID=1930274 RepID=A0A517MNN3_9BACT|nr:hypothetical protein FF011L_53000 [Roseimaritima multifibrata]
MNFKNKILFPEPMTGSPFRFSLYALIGGLLFTLLVVTPAGALPPEGYVLLRNGNVLPGQAVQEGSYVQIQQGSETAIRLPQDQILCWGPTLETLYEYRVTHRQPHSLTARFSDLRWCLEQGLVEIAQEELAALRKLAPNDRRLEGMKALMAHASQKSDSPPSLGVTDSAESTKPPLAESDLLDDPNELPHSLVTVYSARIQTLLINRCGQAGCHGGGSEATWQMDHFGRSGRPSSQMTMENLQQLLTWVHEDQPAASPLLIRASQPHGGAELPPLRATDAGLLSQLQQWVFEAANRNRPQANQALVSDINGPPRVAAAHATASHAISASSDPNQPQRLPPVENPFDPAVFNRMYHRTGGTMPD